MSYKSVSNGNYSKSFFINFLKFFREQHPETCPCLATRATPGQPPRYTIAMHDTDIPTYPCAHCGAVIPRVRAIHQAGYCDSCEYMTTDEVMRYLHITDCQVARWRKAGKLPSPGIPRRYARADVEQQRDKMLQKKTAWLRLIRGGML